MTYKFGQTRAAKEAQEAETRARQKLADLRRLEAELDARIEAAAKATKRLPKVRTYAPTPELAAAWEHFQSNNTNPEPPEAGWRRRQAAAHEAAQYEHDKRRKAA